MNVKVFLCDLTHTAQTISSEFMPYGAGLIAAYLQKKSSFGVTVEVFKFLDELELKISETTPDILAFSYYMWNRDLSLQTARIVKEKFPKTIVIFGGPNFPVQKDVLKQWLIKNNQVDFVIPFEGEMSFSLLVDALYKSNFNTAHVKDKQIPGVNCYDFENDNLMYGGVGQRLKSLKDVPSPYLYGLLDKYFSTPLWPLIETNRGCPFQCAFCSEGNRYYSKVTKRDFKHLKDELLYIAKNYDKNSKIFIADSNFLMFEQDIEICKIFRKTQEKYQWPSFVGCSTGKNKKRIVLEGAKLLKDSITVASSVQSLEQRVLENIKRKNISQKEMLDVHNTIRREGGITYTEVIACLPGDTLASHFNTFKKLIDSEVNLIKHHTLLLLQGADLSSEESREKYLFSTKWRVVTKSFGEYDFFDSRFPSMEYEEIVVGTNCLNFSEYLECRKLGLIVHYFYNDSLFQEVHKFLKYHNIKVWEWIENLYKSLTNSEGIIAEIFSQYIEEVKGELFDDLKELKRDVLSDMGRYLNGEKGSNLTFKYRAILHKYYIKDIYETAFIRLREVLNVNGIKTESMNEFMDQLKRYCIYKKRDIFSTDQNATQSFDFNFFPIESGEFSENIFRKLEKKITINFSHTPEQNIFINEYMSTHAQDNIVDLASFLNRVPASKLYRKISIVKD